MSPVDQDLVLDINFDGEPRVQNLSAKKSTGGPTFVAQVESLIPGMSRALGVKRGCSAGKKKEKC